MFPACWFSFSGDTFPPFTYCLTGFSIHHVLLHGDCYIAEYQRIIKICFLISSWFWFTAPVFTGAYLTSINEIFLYYIIFCNAGIINNSFIFNVEDDGTQNRCRCVAQYVLRYYCVHSFSGLFFTTVFKNLILR